MDAQIARPTSSTLETTQIGRLARVGRERKKWGISYLSYVTGISPNTLEQIEAGQRKPRPHVARVLGTVLGVPELVTFGCTNLSSDRRDLVLNAIRAYVKVHYIAPTFRQLCHETGINSTSMVRYYIHSLIELGKLVKMPGKHTYWYAVPEMVEAIKAIQWK